jgi:Ca-activated chloride channel homolog
VVAGLRQLALGKREKKTLVVMSDGGDNASAISRRQMMGAVLRSAATVYAIGLYDAEDPDRNPGILKEMTHISGGEAFFPANPPETIPICRRIAQDIRNRYTIGFRPQPGKHMLRHIELNVMSVDGRRLNVRTRKSYLYEAPNENPAGQVAPLD